jgi:2,3-bisphosphoglycerate-independent phosphoglycerate mutase
MGSLCLIILDGFGYTPAALGSPLKAARHPNIEKIEKYYPFTTLQASGLAVGLPWGEAGNSEVGHLTIGAGRIIYNHLPRIITSINDGSFFKNSAFLSAIKHVKKNRSSLHIMGLFSSGSVHSYIEHLYALLKLSANSRSPNVYLHLFTDGRDAPPKEAYRLLKQLEAKLKQDYPPIKIGSVIGRHYAMDRDENWSYIKKAYELLIGKSGKRFESASDFVNQNYEMGLTDEYIEGGLNKNFPGVKNGDAVIYFNFREDSARELTTAFVKEDFDKFERKKIDNLLFVTMTQYDKNLPTMVAFPPVEINQPLGKIVSNAGLKQLHIAETEKYAHVTYFFNGGRETRFKNEERILVPSPKTIHYDEIPEMSAYRITEKILQNLANFDFILANFANADMVGHTGNLKACVKAVEVLDECVGRIMKEVIQKDINLIVTGDHGNIEEKLYRFTAKKRTNHTTNPVPFYLVIKQGKRREPRSEEEIRKQYEKIEGTLSDVAPTVLELLGLGVPKEMTGSSLLSKLLS